MPWTLLLEAVDQEPWWLLFIIICYLWDFLKSKGWKSCIKVALRKLSICIKNCWKYLIDPVSAIIQCSISVFLYMMNRSSRNINCWTLIATVLLIMWVLLFRPLIPRNWLISSFAKSEKMIKKWKELGVVLLLWISLTAMMLNLITLKNLIHLKMCL